MSLDCRVYRARRNHDVYLYVDAAQELRRVPQLLLTELGGVVEVLRLELDHGRRLARVDAGSVVEAIRQQGFYLQMPPLADGSSSRC